MPKRATLAEIAREAGVSVPTVSKVVNGRGDVAAQTRRAVEALLDRYEYRSRRSRSRQETGLIDLVFLDLGSPWAMEILAGVEEAAHRAGLGVVVSAVNDRTRPRPDQDWLDKLHARGSDGVVLVLSELSRRRQQRLEALGVPVVLVDPVGAPDPEVPAVGATNWAGGLAATEHLIGLGHRRIAKLSGPPNLLCSRARVDGYRSAMGNAGLPAPAEYLRFGDFRTASGHAETLRLLDLAEPPTAIFAGSDQMALGAYEALFERGLRVPHDVSVVGFDDLPETRWAIPPLTTVRQPLAQMAQVATRMLFDLIAGEEPGSRRVELSTPLITRSSTAPPPPEQRP